MDTTVHAIAHHAPDPLRAVPQPQTVSVSVVYHLSEAGRKASLVAGGDGKGVQRLTVQVPTSRSSPRRVTAHCSSAPLRRPSSMLRARSAAASMWGSGGALQ